MSAIHGAVAVFAASGDGKLASGDDAVAPYLGAPARPALQRLHLADPLALHLRRAHRCGGNVMRVIYQSGRVERSA